MNDLTSKASFLVSKEWNIYSFFIIVSSKSDFRREFDLLGNMHTIVFTQVMISVRFSRLRLVIVVNHKLWELSFLHRLHKWLETHISALVMRDTSSISHLHLSKRINESSFNFIRNFLFFTALIVLIANPHFVDNKWVHNSLRIYDRPIPMLLAQVIITRRTHVL